MLVFATECRRLCRPPHGQRHSGLPHPCQRVGCTYGMILMLTHDLMSLPVYNRTDQLYEIKKITR
jgi:hypothetical protein